LSYKTSNQVSVGNSDFNLTLKVNYIDKKWSYKPKTKNEKGDYYNQLIWFKNKDGNLCQIWNVLDIRHKIIRKTFKGIYKKNVK